MLIRKLLAIGALALVFAAPAVAQDHPIAIVIHGGAGTIEKGDLTPAQEAAYRDKLREAVQAGYQVLKTGGTSLDAVTAAITTMEDSPLFNSGKGAVFNHQGVNELDASIMDGSDLSAGAVAGVRHIKNPILLARAVMEHSRHVLLYGEGAEKFALEQGFELVEPSYFHTEHRWEQLQRAKRSDSFGLDPQQDKTSEQPAQKETNDDTGEETESEPHFGTVGTVALDQFGNIAAGTSTGGLTNKRWGRIGDSPIIGAGTYADNKTCGISGTGEGEYFMRGVVAHDISALMMYKGLSLQEAANKVVMEKLVAMGGDGGVIGLDQEGNIVAVFNTPGMYRASIDTEGDLSIAIYKE